MFVKPKPFWWSQIIFPFIYTHLFIPRVSRVTYALHGTNDRTYATIIGSWHTNRCKLNSGNLIGQMIWWPMNDLYVTGMCNLGCKHHRWSSIIYPAPNMCMQHVHVTGREIQLRHSCCKRNKWHENHQNLKGSQMQSYFTKTAHTRHT